MGGLSLLAVVFSSFAFGFSLCNFIHNMVDVDCCDNCGCCCEDDDDEDDDYEIGE